MLKTVGASSVEAQCACKGKQNMKTPKEIKVLEKVCSEAKTKKKLTEEQHAQLSEAFGSQFSKAWETIEEKRVKKYVFSPSGRIVWIVVGREREYQVMPAAGFCSCDDFYFRVMDREAHICYHLIAQKIADVLEEYDLIEEEDELYDCLMEEWKKVTA
jgi:predicted nucleic acid-binding Zn finger protein